MNLKEKLHAMYSAVEAIEKRGRNKSQSYDYVMAVDVTKAIRGALIQQKVYAEINFEFVGAPYTIARAKEINAPFTAVNVKCYIVFHDLESGETMTGSGLGTGVDTGDKAAYKAQTGALKYALKNAVLAPDEAGADPEADETVGDRFEDAPDFQDAQRGTPKEKTNSRKPAEKPTPSPKQPPASAAPSATAAPSTPPAAGTSPAPAAAAPETTSAAPTAASADGLPNEEQLTAYRKKFQKLGDDLSTEGKLKASKGLPLNRKVLAFLLHITQAPDASKITTAQWDNFFQRVDDIKSKSNGMVALAQKVNEVNGITK